MDTFMKSLLLIGGVIFIITTTITIEQLILLTKELAKTTEEINKCKQVLKGWRDKNTL